MATKLRNLKVTKVDFVDQGANPDAYVCLFKRKDGEPGEGLQKGAKLFAEMQEKERMRKITSEMFDFCYALSDSLSSIICDNDLTPDSKQTMMTQNLKEFGEAMDQSVLEWSKGNEAKKAQGNDPPAELQKSAEQQEAKMAFLRKRGLADIRMQNTIKEEYDTMNIDKSKMTPEELAVLESFEKKYGADDKPEDNPVPDGVNKGAGNGVSGEAEPDEVNKGISETEPAANQGSAGRPLSDEIAKALADVRKAYAAQTQEVEALKKSLEIERLNQVAKKYELLGKKSDELAAKLYDLKKAGGTVYDDYIALLDENLAMIGKSGVFREIGSSRQGSMGSEESIGIKAAELAKSANGGMTHAEAVVKAFEENPELAAQYEEEYMRR